MKVGMILDGLFPTDARVEREALALIAEGHEVHLWAFTKDPKKKFEEYNGIKVHYAHRNNLIYKASAMAIDWPIYHLLLRKHVQSFLKNQFDVIHVHDMTIAGLVMKLKKSEKLVLDLHENRPEIMRYYPHLKRFPTNILINLDRWKRAEMSYIKKSDAVIVVTKEAAEYYGKANSNYCVVPNTAELATIDAIPIDQSLVDRYKDNFVVLYIGDLGSRRGIYELIEAADLLEDQIPELKVVMVGDSSERPSYEQLVDQKNLQDFVDFEGFQPHDLLFSYIKAANVGTSPLWRNIHHDTTFANKVFQYMSLGLPQVVSDCPAQENVVEECNAGLIHTSKVPQDLADKIYDLYANPEKAETLGLSARKSMEEIWDWKYKKQALVNLYRGFQAD